MLRAAQFLATTFAAICLVALGCAGRISNAEVVRFEITREAPYAGGHAFGPSGPYQVIEGRYYGEVDPSAATNSRVTDLALAPRNERGRVEYWSDFVILSPQDQKRGSRRLLYDVNNRGNKLALGAFNSAGSNDPFDANSVGNGFLFREGLTVCWCGWNGDVKAGDGRLQIGLPVATENGQPITGKIYSEICVDQRSPSQPLAWGNTDPYPASSLDTSMARLTRRTNRRSAEVLMSPSDWAFARSEENDVIADPKSLWVRGGLEPGMLYELEYQTIAPRVTGLGFVAVRDFVSWLRYGDARQSPPVGPIERAYGFGISQSGRFLQHMVFEGLHVDHLGRPVFDGLMPHVGGAGKGLFNYRFAQTTRHGSQHQDNLFPSEFFPFAPVLSPDPITGTSGDLLARAKESGFVPRIFFIESASEYWCRAASLLHTDVTGRQDLTLDEHTRLYFMTGAQHGVSSSTDRGMYANPINNLDHRPLVRALFVALDAWVSQRVEPPASAYPRLQDGTLVDLANFRSTFPNVPEIALPEAHYVPLRLDPGPRWHTQGIADNVPPVVGEPYVTLVPAVGTDGNELAGVRLPEIEVPIATYTGWNVRGPDAGAPGALGRWSGSFIPLAPTAAKRAQQDHRPSVQELYPSRDVYLGRIAAAARRLVAKRLLLADDAVNIIAAAADRELWD